ncbi:unnamed protein product [Rhizoctonia solani]|uniref:Fungal-type protein kinase domain-containing protein n=1 Tax=Rhizoctonia solani TaxID=456999 RepID=A0A8H3AZX7_9AGAM|nr:unnamed protein product [Rhizoctonia solani]
MGDTPVENEIYENLFHDPGFFERFLPGPSTKLDNIIKYCRRTNVYARRTNSWNPTQRGTRRSGAEPPLLKFLNTIIRGTHATNSSDHSVAPALFIDWPAENVPTDIKKHQLPDYLLFDGVSQDWSGVRTAIKLMSQPGHRKMGMVHLARYAKTIFSHQLHRRHIYHLMVCGTEATFVRFDRAGVLYSPVIDLCQDAEAFIRAFASLMMLDRASEGFDPLFSTKRSGDNLIVYYLDLPHDAIPTESGSDHGKSPTRKFQVREILCHGSDISPTRKFQVREILCHGSDIVGGATTVLLLRNVLEPPEPKVRSMPTRKGKRKRADVAPAEEERIGDTTYIMKMVWRDPREAKESDLFKMTDGMYGLAQHVWARDASRQCTCAEPKEDCTTDLVFSKKEFNPKGDNKEGPELDTSEYRPATRRRLRLVYSYLLMSSVGVPVEDAETPRQYMNAVLDAFLGYWRLFNLGYIHRDISSGNILVLNPEQAFHRREWKEPITDLSDIQDEEIKKSEQKLREVVARLDRDPTGILIDFSFCVRHSGQTPVETKSEVEFHGTRKRVSQMSDFNGRKRRRLNMTKSYAFRDTSEPLSDYGEEVPEIDFRTGTSQFMSASVLGSTFGKPYRHSYLDDLESFFWLVYLGAVGHTDGDRELNMYQAHELAVFDDPDMKKLAKFKARVIDQYTRMSFRLDLYDNSWSKSYAFRKVLLELEEFFRDVWNQKDPGMTPVEAFGKMADVLLNAVGY